MTPRPSVTAAVLLGALSAPAAAKTPPRLATPLAVAEVTSTSTLAGPARQPDRYAPFRVLAPEVALVDSPSWTMDAPDAAWCEARPDEGTGEAITIKLAGPRAVRSVAVQAGFWKSQKLFAANNRPTRLGLETDDGQKLAVAAPAGRKEALFKLSGKPITAITLRFLAVKKGRINDTCISRITVDGVRSAVVGVDAAAQAAVLPNAFAALAKDLNGWQPALKGGLAYPFRYEDGSLGADHEWKSHDEFESTCSADGDADAMSCPFPPFLDETIKRKGPWYTLTAPGRLRITFYHNGECWDSWWLEWGGGTWRLRRIDSASIGPPG